ncbi:MAG: EAL domain-containing protein [Chroococcidiopsidaceae cyanobacterium CP_BM_RX_35]|nr:EAL domain-containing protein [Chroococcidiopsidaceae cyanobacterium CP_BM_RX_35]
MWGDTIIKEIKIFNETILLVRISDITERKQAEEALQQAKDELERRVEERTAELSQSNLLLKQEIGDRQRAEEQLTYGAFHDALTGLPNRALFVERLRQAVELKKWYEGYLFAVLFLDLDRFKVVNDSLGHMAGDQLLLAIASRIKACLRAEDIVARIGGDEFTILLEGIQDVSEAKSVANRIQEQLKLPFILSGNEVFTSASIGIALSVTDYDRPEQILRDADMAMYKAKMRGKARHEVFDITMHSSAIARLQVETDLRRAIERQEFRLHYQPIVSLDSGTINGFEALVRWQHPERGLVSPAEFIPMAEETGLIVPLGWWVIHEACHQMHVWQAQFLSDAPLSISINISGRQFSQLDLSDRIEQILQEFSLDPRTLKLELTESAIVENVESANLMLAQLRKLGIQLCMDDFGTGYSSLSYLHRFPIDMLKIDRSFVSRMSLDNENSEIVRTIVTLAHNLGMNMTAEGVETAEQLALLKELKCEYGQGYFFSKPINSEAATALIPKLGVG